MVIQRAGRVVGRWLDDGAGGMLHDHLTSAQLAAHQLERFGNRTLLGELHEGRALISFGAGTGGSR